MEKITPKNSTNVNLVSGEKPTLISDLNATFADDCLLSIKFNTLDQKSLNRRKSLGYSPSNRCCKCFEPAERNKKNG